MLNTRVKICGITRPEDAEFAAQTGADAIGMVFYEKSARFVSDLALAREIAEAAGPFTSVVALFVNAEPAEIEHVLTSVPVQLLQFHGDELPEQCDVYERPYVKAIRMRPDIDVIAEFTRYKKASGFLLDTYVKGSPGGTGECFNWDRFPSNSASTAQPLPHLVLAGGLTPENVDKAIAATSPYAVDVSGGVEVQPGIKDHQKIKAFITKAKTGVQSE